MLIEAIDYGELARALIREGLPQALVHGGLPQAIAHELAPAPPAAFVTKDELAARWRCCAATVDRMARQGMPVERVTGDAPRFDVAACDAWRRERPVMVRTKPVPRDPHVEPVDMTGVRKVSGGGKGGR